MKFSRLQLGLLSAIDSKDFGNLAEYLNRHGPITFPGARFTWIPSGRVLVEHDPRGPMAHALKELEGRFYRYWGAKMRRLMRGEPVKMPALPRFQICPLTNQLIGE